MRLEFDAALKVWNALDGAITDMTCALPSQISKRVEDLRNAQTEMRKTMMPITNELLKLEKIKAEIEKVDPADLEAHKTLVSKIYHLVHL